MADDFMGEKVLVGLQWDAGLQSLKQALDAAKQLIDSNPINLEVKLPKEFRDKLNKELKAVAQQLNGALKVVKLTGDPNSALSIGQTASQLAELTKGFRGLSNARKEFNRISTSASMLSVKLQEAAKNRKLLDDAQNKLTQGSGQDLKIDIDTQSLEDAALIIAESIEKITASVRELVGELKSSQDILNKAANANTKIKEKGLGVDVTDQENATKRYKAQAEMLEARAKANAAEAKVLEANAKYWKALRAEQDSADAALRDQPDPAFVKEAKKTLSDTSIKSLTKELQTGIQNNAKFGSGEINKTLTGLSTRLKDLQKLINDIDWSDESSINKALTDYRNLKNELADVADQLRQAKAASLSSNQSLLQSNFTDFDTKVQAAQGLSGSKIGAYGNELNSIIAQADKLKKILDSLDTASTESINATIAALKKLDGQLDKLTGNTKLDKINTKGVFTELSGGSFLTQAESIANTYGKIVSNTVRSSEVGKTWIGVVKQQNGQLVKLRMNLDSTGTGIRTLSSQLSGSASLFTNLGISLREIAANFMRYFSGQEIFQRLVQGAREGWSEIKELDAAFTELRKVSDETTAELMEFREESFGMADDIASTGEAIQQSAADWARLGYAIEEASEFAKNTTLYANVGDMNIDTATEHMIASVKAFGQEFRNEVEASEKIADIYNELDKVCCPGHVRCA